MSVLFFPGIDDVHNAHLLNRCLISVNRLWSRKSSFLVSDWILDSGAFTSVTKHGGYLDGDLERYANAVNRWGANGKFLAAVSQDYMCEPFVLSRTGLSVAEHQRLTIERYKALRSLIRQDLYLMPVLQGFKVSEYLSCLSQYGDLLAKNQWVGVGSVCKRNAKPGQVEAILRSIKSARPDLRLHGFGIKLTALQSQIVQECLHSADSMAWSFAARYEGRNAHDPQEAIRYARKVDSCPVQANLFSMAYETTRTTVQGIEAADISGTGTIATIDSSPDL